MTVQPTPEQIRAFLLDLRELTMRHGIAIAGCGCCCSPYLMAAQTSGACGYKSDEYGGSVEWMSPDDAKSDPNYAQTIVLPEKEANDGQ